MRAPSAEAARRDIDEKPGMLLDYIRDSEPGADICICPASMAPAETPPPQPRRPAVDPCHDLSYACRLIDHSGGKLISPVVLGWHVFDDEPGAPDNEASKPHARRATAAHSVQS